MLLLVGRTVGSMASILDVVSLYGDPRIADAYGSSGARVRVSLVGGTCHAHAPEGCMEVSEGVNEERIVCLEDLSGMVACGQCGHWDVEMDEVSEAWVESACGLRDLLDGKSAFDQKGAWTTSVGLLYEVRELGERGRASLEVLSIDVEREAREALLGGYSGERGLPGNVIVAIDRGALEKGGPWTEYAIQGLASGGTIFFGKKVVIVTSELEGVETRGQVGGVLLSTSGEHDILDSALGLGGSSAKRLAEVWPSARRLVRAAAMA